MTKNGLKDRLDLMPNHRIHDVLSYSIKREKLIINVNDDLPSVSIDINGYWYPPLNLKGLLIFIKAFLDSINFHWDLTEGSSPVFRPFVLIKNLFNKDKSYELFSAPWSGWVWCLSSLEEEVEKYLEKKSWELVAIKNQKGSLDYRRKDVVNKFGSQKDKIYQEIKSSFKETDEEFVSYMSEERGLVPVGFVWINVNDPTVFVVDPKVCPYSHEKGWNKDEVSAALSLWLKEIGVNIPVVFGEN